jgi:hypothetical protein
MKKKRLSVDTKQLEQAFDVDLHEFEPGEHPLSELMDALGLFHVHGRPKLRPRSNVRGDTK